ncbi:hypothetical protein JYT44_02890 [Caldithrix abyssi]|nr:hypothetical protein [Caldithrix abyssi]
MDCAVRRIVQVILLLSLGWAATPWGGESASVLPHGRREIGLFSPFRIGLNHASEIAVNKFLLMPNISYKSEIPQFHGWEMAYRLQFAYPTLALRWLQSPLGKELGEPDILALISPEFPIPQMVSVYGELIGTNSAPGAGKLTLNAGVGIGFNGKELAHRATIDLPIIYPRLSVYYNGVLLKVGGEYFRQFKERWSYVMDYDMFIMPGGEGRYAFEQKGLMVWTKSERFRLLFGYKLIAGEYPFGAQAHLLPLLDLQFGW